MKIFIDDVDGRPKHTGVLETRRQSKRSGRSSVGSSNYSSDSEIDSLSHPSSPESSFHALAKCPSATGHDDRSPFGKPDFSSADDHRDEKQSPNASTSSKIISPLQDWRSPLDRADYLCDGCIAYISPRIETESIVMLAKELGLPENVIDLIKEKDGQPCDKTKEMLSRWRDQIPHDEHFTLLRDALEKCQLNDVVKILPGNS